MNFGIISPKDLSPEDFLLLQESVKKDYTGVSTEQIIGLAYQDLCRIWKGEDPLGGRILAVTQVLDHAGTKELFIWHFAGSHNNIFRIKNQVQARFEEYAKAMKCSRIATEADDPMARFLLSMRYQPTHQRMVKEI